MIIIRLTYQFINFVGHDIFFYVVIWLFSRLVLIVWIFIF